MRSMPLDAPQLKTQVVDLPGHLAESESQSIDQGNNTGNWVTIEGEGFCVSYFDEHNGEHWGQTFTKYRCLFAGGSDLVSGV